MSILLLPISVSAGLVGALSNIFSKVSGEEKNIDSKNLQNMNLLVAVAPHASSNSLEQVKEITIEEDALVATPNLSNSLPTTVHKSSSDQISIYVVREGDTLSQIAEMFGVTVNTIKWGNDLPSNTVKPGDTLVILPISGVRHTVVKGDTLESLAKKYKGDIEEIAAYNSLTKGSSLALGTEIIIPDGEVLPSSPSYSGSAKSSSSLKEYSGYYMRPVVGGKRTQGMHGHNGIDIGASLGTPILAAAEGDVIISRTGGWNGGYGNYVVIKHTNGTQTLYAHNTSNAVSAGDHVKQGDIIGFMGSTGKATGVHLHFEVRGAKNPF